MNKSQCYKNIIKGLVCYRAGFDFFWWLSCEYSRKIFLIDTMTHEKLVSDRNWGKKLKLLQPHRSNILLLKLSAMIDSSVEARYSLYSVS